VGGVWEGVWRRKRGAEGMEGAAWKLCKEECGGGWIWYGRESCICMRMVEDTQKRSQAALRVSMMLRLGLAGRALATLLCPISSSAASQSPSLTAR